MIFVGCLKVFLKDGKKLYEAWLTTFIKASLGKLKKTTLREKE